MDIGDLRRSGIKELGDKYGDRVLGMHLKVVAV